MDSVDMPPSISLVECCNCGCSCSTMNGSLSGTCLRSVKRKFNELKEENQFTVPGLILPQNARVEIENECMALRETVSSQQQTIQDLIDELEEERDAASSAANEAMSMILRLQREKAEIQMEGKQFKRFVEEKMAHDQQEMLALEDLLYKREQSILSLRCEVQAYKHRIMSYDLTEAEAEAEAEADGENSMIQYNSITENLNGQFELLPYELYPPLKCNFSESQAYPDGDDEAADVEKYAFGETPRSKVHLKDFEYRINQLEKKPMNIQPEAELDGVKNMVEKVIVGQSPRQPRHSRKFSDDSSNSLFATGKDLGPESPKFGGSFKNGFSQMENSNLRKVDTASEVGDDTTDRVYTIDSVHQEAHGLKEPKISVGMGDDYMMTTPRESLIYSDVKDPDIQKLYARLQALEADRESMRQAIVSIGTDKAQFVLLKEIAQNLCKEMTPERRMPVKNPPVVGSFSFIAIFKWIINLNFLRRKVRRCRYMFGLSSNNNAGLLMLLDRGPHVGQWRYLSSTQV